MQVLRSLRFAEKLGKVFFHHFLIGLLVIGLAVPPQALFAEPPANTTSVAGTPEGEDPLVTRQRQRDAIVGLNSERAVNDPWFVANQKVIKEEWRRLHNGDGAGPGEVLHVEPGVRWAIKSTVYDFDHPNSAYKGPSRYVLGDVDFTIEPDHLIAKYEVMSRQGKTVYKRVFDIPGVQSVSKNRVLVNFVMKNGDIRNILGAHVGLFDANEMAGGAPHLCPLISVIPTGSPQPEAIDQDLVIVSYDARNTNLVFPAELEKFRPDLRHGDDLIAKKQGEKFLVQDLLPLSSIAEALKAHLTLLKVRERFLTGKMSLKEMFAAMEDGMKELAAKGAQATLPAAVQSEQFFSMIEQEPLARAQRRTQGQWQNNPLERPGFENKQLGPYLKFVEGLGELAANLDKRSTYPVDSDKKTPLDEGTYEREQEAALEKLAEEAELQLSRSDLIHGSTLPGSARWIKAAALAAGGGAVAYFLGDQIVNAALWMLPATITDWSFRIPLFDLGKFGGPAGPMVPYSVKIGVLTAAMTAIYFLGVPITSAYLSERVIGQRLDRGFSAGLRKTLKNGWKVFSSVAVRIGAWVNQSYKGVVAGMVGQGDTIQAMRYGATPGEYFAELEKQRKEVEAGGTRSASLSTVQNARDSGKLTSLHYSLYHALESLRLHLGKSPDPSLMDRPLNSFLLLRQLGQDKFDLLEARFRLVCARAEGVLKGTPKSTYTAFAANPAIQSAMLDPFAPLTPAEAAEVAKLEKAMNLERTMAKVAGSNEFYFKYRNAVANPRNTDVFESIFPNDNAPHILISAMTPSEFTNRERPDMLVASNDSWFVGLIGNKPAVEEMFNIVGWISLTSTDELTYGREEAVQIDSSFLNPQYTERGVAYRTLEQKSPANYTKSMGQYLNALNPFSADFWEGLQRLGKRITVDQLKTWKPIIAVGAVTTFLGFLLSWDKLMETNVDFREAGILGKAVLLTTLTTYKVILANTWAFVLYRVFWMWHSIGIRNNKSEVDEEFKEYVAATDMLARMALAPGMYSDDEKKTARDRVIHFYQKHRKPIPSGVLNPVVEVASGEQVDIEALKLTRLSWHALHNPAVTTAPHWAADFTTTQLMGFITTAIGVIGGGLAWVMAEKFGLAAITAITAGTYGYGWLTRWGGGQVRAWLSYGRYVPKLRTALEQLSKQDTTANRQQVLNAIFELRKVYARYGANIQMAGVDPSTITLESDLLDIGTQLYLAVLMAAPADNMTVRSTVDKEYKSDFCQAAIRRYSGAAQSNDQAATGTED